MVGFIVAKNYNFIINTNAINTVFNNLVTNLENKKLYVDYFTDNLLKKYSVTNLKAGIMNEEVGLKKNNILGIYWIETALSAKPIELFRDTTIEFAQIIENQQDFSKYLSNLNNEITFLSDTLLNKLQALVSIPVFTNEDQKNLDNFAGTLIMVTELNNPEDVTHNINLDDLFITLSSSSGINNAVLGRYSSPESAKAETYIDMWNSIVHLTVKASEGLGLGQILRIMPQIVLIVSIMATVIIIGISRFWINVINRIINKKTAPYEKIIVDAEELGTIINSAPLVLFSINNEGKVLSSVGGALSLIGSKPNQNVGKSIWEMYKDFPEIIANLKKALSGETLTDVVKVGAIYFETVYAPIKESEKIIGATGVAIDVTKSVVTQQQIEKRNKEMESLNKYTVDRELKMIELKKEIEDLKLKLKTNKK